MTGWLSETWLVDFLANLLDTAHVIIERFVALWVGEAECFFPWFGGNADVLGKPPRTRGDLFFVDHGGRFR